MAVRRRTVLGWLAATLAAPLLPLLGRVLPERVVRAIQSRRYPGPVRPLDREEVSRPGRWMG